jgi:hypothetical protein
VQAVALPASVPRLAALAKERCKALKTFGYDAANANAGLQAHSELDTQLARPKVK